MDVARRPLLAPHFPAELHLDGAPQFSVPRIDAQYSERTSRRGPRAGRLHARPGDAAEPDSVSTLGRWIGLAFREPGRSTVSYPGLDLRLAAGGVHRLEGKKLLCGPSVSDALRRRRPGVRKSHARKDTLEPAGLRRRDRPGDVSSRAALRAGVVAGELYQLSKSTRNRAAESREPADRAAPPTFCR